MHSFPLCLDQKSPIDAAFEAVTVFAPEIRIPLKYPAGKLDLFAAM